ncbi:MAG TPA: phosphohistidine phosphatase SixA [Myxococcota bacterium]|jgi:phosphohistidine phosphatase
MDLLVIRHGQAEPRGEGGSDASRRLTEDGRKKLRRGAKGLRKLVPELDLLVSSPLVRAVETAAIVSEAYGGLAVEETPCLEPEREPKELADWLAERSAATLAIVGHEPLLSHAVSWFLSGLRSSFVELKTGSACLLSFPDEIGAGRARLIFALDPWQLRRMR